jgi:hypothetical protein
MGLTVEERPANVNGFRRAAGLTGGVAEVILHVHQMGAVKAARQLPRPAAPLPARLPTGMVIIHISELRKETHGEGMI